ncbi:2-dehydropantoate 2-reductase [Auriscalpium vulgare]|uniref:2-dehydropantoate 2-reductase n=1 Tax=Auriscalpium vulgare TaxID=40419 RepID=A0ACB8RM75_9AGAM|nr:2-dehydropantoate 2-reductase [Auriscalpium vulgare]
MRFHVLGVGAIGTLVAHHLRETLDPKHAVVLIHKSAAQRRRAIEKRNTIRVEANGVSLFSTGYRSEYFQTRPQMRHDRRARGKRAMAAAQAEDTGVVEEQPDVDDGPAKEIESLIVTTKAYSVLDAIKGLLPRISPKTTIVLLHNGMGVYEQLLAEVFRNPLQRPSFIVASNSHGAWTKDYLNCVHAGQGEIVFGIAADAHAPDFEAGLGDPYPSAKWPPPLDAITTGDDDDAARYLSLRNTVAALSALPGLKSTWQPIARVLVALKRKLVVNCAVNPLTAVLGCRNGDLLDSSSGRLLIRSVCAEAALAFALDEQGTVLPAGHSLGEERREKHRRLDAGFSRVPPALTAEALEEEVLRVATATGNNISSMLADVRNGSYTEIDYMNGYLVGLGRANRLNMSTTTALMHLVKMRSSLPIDRLSFKL